MGVVEFCAAVLHAYAIRHDDAVCSACDKYVVLFAPGHATDFACVAGEGHTWWTLPGVEFIDMDDIAGSGCKILPTIGKFHKSTIPKRVDIFKITDRLAIFL